MGKDPFYGQFNLRQFFLAEALSSTLMSRSFLQWHRLWLLIIVQITVGEY